MILIVGATGQLGTALVQKLAAAEQPVRAFVRRGSRYQHWLMISTSEGELKQK